MACILIDFLVFISTQKESTPRSMVQRFEYNLITQVNHTYFANIVTGGATTELTQKFPKFFSDVFDSVASERYDLIPAAQFEGGNAAWVDDDTLKTDEQKDMRAAEAFLPTVLNSLRPHVSTKEFVTTVREQDEIPLEPLLRRRANIAYPYSIPI
jgi:hypothetical protein